MAKMRVNELAKKIDISNKELIAFLNDNKIAAVKSHANSITDEEASVAIKLYKNLHSKKDDNFNKNFESSNINKDNSKTNDNIKNDEENKINKFDNAQIQNDKNKSDKILEHHMQQSKSKFVMKINPQNIGNKNQLAKMANQKSNGKSKNKITKLSFEENQKRQEILERQKKIDEYKRLKEEEERKIAKKRADAIKQQEISTNDIVKQQIKEVKVEENAVNAKDFDKENKNNKQDQVIGMDNKKSMKSEKESKKEQIKSINVAVLQNVEKSKNMENIKDMEIIKDVAKPKIDENTNKLSNSNNIDNNTDKKSDKLSDNKKSPSDKNNKIDKDNMNKTKTRFDVKNTNFKNNRDNKGNNRNNNKDNKDNKDRNNRRDNKNNDFNKKSDTKFDSKKSVDDRDNKKTFKVDGFNKNRNDRRFDKDKDEQEIKGHKERPRSDKKRSSSSAIAVPGLDDRSKKAKEKVREKTSRNKDKRKDKQDKFQERNFSLERTSKKTHKIGAKTKQDIKIDDQTKESEKISLIVIPEMLTIKELANKMKIPASTLIKELFLKGKVVTVNQKIDFETAEEIAMEHEILCELEEKVDVIEEMLKEDDELEETLVKRPPVVCVMGHVDHGKTSLLDAIRNTHVIEKEAGGITQHIGAYVVKVGNQKITFLDTPGHEAFTAMRMRGAKSTDIAILVVAADDGVMPQTIEAINHAKAAGIEIIVAINKIDKPSANVDRVKQELADQGLIPEDWGGSNIFVPVSAKAGIGLDELLEMIILTADVAELKANPNRKARGLVLEAKLDKGRGSVANILIQKGTLHVGDFISAGHCSGKVRAMIDDKGRKIKSASISMPVEILGLNEVPNAGEILVAHDTDKDAKNFAATFVSEGREKMIEDTKAKMSLDDLFAKIKEENLKEFSIVVKADVQGSAEAIKQSLEKLSNDEVVVKIIHSGVGSINESDVILASASNAIIIGFNVRPDAQAKNVAESEGVDIRLYGVIYQAIEDVESAMKGMLDPIYEEQIIGHAEIRQIFKASGIGNIAGSYVLDGFFERDCNVRISRDNEQIFEGKLASLKRFKDDVKEVKAGFECGLVFDGFNDIMELDTVEAYKIVEVKR